MSIVAGEGGTAVSNGIRKVAENAREAFGANAPAVLRKWQEGDGDRRWGIAADLLEKEGREAGSPQESGAQ